MSNQLIVNGIVYKFIESFDVNLTVNYENNSWDSWHILREFISNALDGVGGDAERISITTDDNHINIADEGPGYPIVYAKRIGASSKKGEQNSIGQFGEGTKLSILTCLRKDISILIASQDWLIVPKLVSMDGFEVLYFDIYQSELNISGSLVRMGSTKELESYLNNKEQSFLQFSSCQSLFGNRELGIYPIVDKPKIYNKGVFIKEINALFSYALSIEELNRDRDLISEDTLAKRIRDLWELVDNEQLATVFYLQSQKIAQSEHHTHLIEFQYSVYPKFSSIWKEAFYHAFGIQSVIYTSPLAAKEALSLGYNPITLHYCGKNLAQHVGIPSDVDLIRDDYEFTWSTNLTRQEEKRLKLFLQLAQHLQIALPKDIKVFDNYEKSSSVLGIYDKEKDAIYIKRERLNSDPELALETFLHELMHRHTEADDYDREFANGLSMLAANTLLKLMKESGFSISLNITQKGIQLPKEFTFSADNMISHIATVGNQLVIYTSGRKLVANLKTTPKPYSSVKNVVFHRGEFYVPLPPVVRDILLSTVEFWVTQEI